MRGRSRRSELVPSRRDQGVGADARLLEQVAGVCRTCDESRWGRSGVQQAGSSGVRLGPPRTGRERIRAGTVLLVRCTAARLRPRRNGYRMPGRPVIVLALARAARPRSQRRPALGSREPEISSTTSTSPSIRASVSATWPPSPARSNSRSTRAPATRSPRTSTRLSQRGSEGRRTRSRPSEPVGHEPEPGAWRGTGSRPRPRPAAGRPPGRAPASRTRSARSPRTARAAGSRRRSSAASSSASKMRVEVLVEAVLAQPERDHRGVVRPDRAEVVADRVVARLARRQRADPPAGEHRVATSARRARRARAPAATAQRPQQVALVGGERRAGAAVGAEAHRVVAALGQPEALEPLAQRGRARAAARPRAARRRRARTGAPAAAWRAARTPAARPARSAAPAACRARRGCLRRSPSSPGCAGPPGARAAVLEQAVTVAIPGPVDPAEHRLDLRRAARGTATGRRSSRRARTAGRGTAAWRRRCRSSARAA